MNERLGGQLLAAWQRPLPSRIRLCRLVVPSSRKRPLEALGALHEPGGADELHHRDLLGVAILRAEGSIDVLRVGEAEEGRLGVDCALRRRAEAILQAAQVLERPLEDGLGQLGEKVLGHDEEGERGEGPDGLGQLSQPVATHIELNEGRHLHQRLGERRELVVGCRERRQTQRAHAARQLGELVLGDIEAL